MRTLASLRETRAARTDAIRAIVAAATAENRDLNDAEQSAFEAGRAEVEKLDRDIRNAEFLAEAERRAHAEPVAGTGDSLAGIALRFQVGKALAEFADGRLTGAEAEWAAEHRSGRPGAVAMPTCAFLGERRALTTSTPAGGPGGNLVATEQGPLIDRLRPLLAVESMGATVLSGLTANLDLPRLKSSGSAGWVAEHANASRSDASFDKVSMAPKTVSAEYELSRRMMIQAPQVEGILRADIGYLLAQALDAAAVKGGGTNEPVGLLSVIAGANVVAMGADGGAMTIDTTADLIGAVADANATGATGFLTNTKVRRAAMKLKDGQGKPFGVPAVFQNEPVVFTNQVPANLSKGTGTNLSAILYGVWSDLVIGYWSAVDIVVNPYHSDVASKGGALLHAFLDADIGIRHAESFSAVKDVAA